MRPVRFQLRLTHKIAAIGFLGVVGLAAVGLSRLLGVWNGFLVAVLGIQPIIATLILMTAGRGIAMLITEGNILTVASAPFKLLGSGFFVGIPVATIIGAVILVWLVRMIRGNKTA